MPGFASTPTASPRGDVCPFRHAEPPHCACHRDGRQSPKGACCYCWVGAPTETTARQDRKNNRKAR